MIRALLAALLLTACASSQAVESRTEPLTLYGDVGPPCSVRVELGGVVYVFSSWAGCAVVTRKVEVPWYHSDRAYKP